MKGTTMSTDTDSKTTDNSSVDPGDLFAKLASMGRDDLKSRQTKINSELTTGFARFAYLVNTGEIPVDVVLRLTEFFDSSADASVNGRELPALGQSSNDGTSSGGSPQLSDAHQRVLTAYDKGDIPFDLRTGQVRGLEKNSQAEDGLRHIIRELKVQTVSGDSPLDWAQRIVDEAKDQVNKASSSSGSGSVKSVDTSKTARNMGLPPDAPIERIEDRAKELNARPDAKVDLTPIAQALEVKKPDPTVDDLAKAATDAMTWKAAASEVAQRVKDVTGVVWDGKENHVALVTRGLEHGPITASRKAHR